MFLEFESIFIYYVNLFVIVVSHYSGLLLYPVTTKDKCFVILLLFLNSHYLYLKVLNK